MRIFINRIKSFRKEEDGSMIVFGLFLFSAILMVGGVGLTIIAHEKSRLQLQNTIDASVLAAADLNQTLDATSVVTDYFDKAGLLDNLVRVEVTEGVNSREVLAEAEMSVLTYWLGAVGESAWTVNSIGAAREDISDIEISMVLDTSGSMGSYGRLDALKTAAKDFVDDVLLVSTGGTNSGDVSVSIIPYSTQVSMPQTVLDQMTLDHRHSYSGCVDFEANDFDTTALPITARAQTAHFDVMSSGITPSRWTCADDAQYESLLFSQSVTDLHSAIDGLTAYENTSIDLGVKWGAAMLDPDSNTIVDALITAGDVSADFTGRPYEFNDRTKMKVMVVMTDGANTTQYMMDDAYASGDSDVWRYGDNWTVHVPGASLLTRLDGDLLDNLDAVVPTSSGYWGGYWWGGWNQGGGSTCWWLWWCWDDDSNDDSGGSGGTPADGTTAADPLPEDYFLAYDRTWLTAPFGDPDAVLQDWQDVWANFTVAKQAEDLRYEQFYDYATYDQWYYDVWSSVDATEKDSRLDAICTAAKDAGIIVFTMGFEITSSNAAKMESCASSANHYFDVDNSSIDLAFAAIANAINQLRLVQ